MLNDLNKLAKMNFPYISQFHINNCYTYQNFDVPSKPLKEFKHIILTGKNGTGKTSILKRIAVTLSQYKEHRNREHAILHFEGLIQHNQQHPYIKQWEEDVTNLRDINLFFLGEKENLLMESKDYVFSFFKAHRKVELKEVSTVTKETEFIKNLTKNENSENFMAEFKQYLVNKKVFEAFDFMNNGIEKSNENKVFFDKLTNILRKIFNDKTLQLSFEQESFEFYIILDGGRKITFNKLSEGFSAFISILMELLMRVDLIKKYRGDFSYDPSGIVLIDEPETHLHIEMQYEILPLLTTIFPNIQFIIATHSPAIISSIKNAIIFDLTSREEIYGLQVGRSYSDLMINHFGLDNEFSSIADKIILEVTEAVKENNKDKLKEIIMKNENILTPSLRFEIENQIIVIESRK